MEIHRVILPDDTHTTDFQNAVSYMMAETMPIMLAEWDAQHKAAYGEMELNLAQWLFLCVNDVGVMYVAAEGDDVLGVALTVTATPIMYNKNRTDIRYLAGSEQAKQMLTDYIKAFHTASGVDEVWVYSLANGAEVATRI